MTAATIERSEAEFTPDPGAAITALGAAEVQGTPTEQAKRAKHAGGRPPGSKNKARDERRAEARKDTRTNRVKDRDPRTRAELLAELSAQKARLDLLGTSTVDLQAAKECIRGIITVFDMGMELAAAPELSFTPSEQVQMAELWGPPAAPYLAKLGSAQPWVGAVAGTLVIMWPKWRAYIDRRELDAKKEVIVKPAEVKTNPDGSPIMEVHHVHELTNE